MKLLSIAVPSYNSEAYLSNCIESLLAGGERVEIIIIDDGSKDKTGEIADAYAAKYPTIVKAIHQPNGGHGEGVNQGLAHATGLYYKVVDSDDLLAKEGYLKLLDTIEEHQKEGKSPDLYIANFVYEHIEDNTQYVSDYVRYMPKDQFFSWDKVRRFKAHHMLLMHSLYYRRDTLLSSHTVLPKHCFYVDDIFAYKPLPYCKTIFYLNQNIYRYRIGRSDQSVNEVNFVKRYPQQLTVMRGVLDSYRYQDIRKMPKGLMHYLFHALADLHLATLFSISGGKDEPKARKKIFYQYLHEIRTKDHNLYRKLVFRSYYTLIWWLPYGIKKHIISFGYKMARKIAKLG
jgi:glycosyltransferase involved in cell wall biosynthesis